MNEDNVPSENASAPEAENRRKTETVKQAFVAKLDKTVEEGVKKVDKETEVSHVVKARQKRKEAGAIGDFAELYAKAQELAKSADDPVAANDLRLTLEALHEITGLDEYKVVIQVPDITEDQLELAKQQLVQDTESFAVQAAEKYAQRYDTQLQSLENAKRNARALVTSSTVSSRETRKTAYELKRQLHQLVATAEVISTELDIDAGELKVDLPTLPELRKAKELSSLTGDEQRQKISQKKGEIKAGYEDDDEEKLAGALDRVDEEEFEDIVVKIIDREEIIATQRENLGNLAVSGEAEAAVAAAEQIKQAENAIKAYEAALKICAQEENYQAARKELHQVWDAKVEGEQSVAAVVKAFGNRLSAQAGLIVGRVGARLNKIEETESGEDNAAIQEQLGIGVNEEVEEGGRSFRNIAIDLWGKAKRTKAKRRVAVSQDMNNLIMNVSKADYGVYVDNQEIRTDLAMRAQNAVREMAHDVGTRLGTESSKEQALKEKAARLEENEKRRDAMLAKMREKKVGPHEEYFNRKLMKQVVVERPLPPIPRAESEGRASSEFHRMVHTTNAEGQEDYYLYYWDGANVNVERVDENGINVSFGDRSRLTGSFNNLEGAQEAIDRNVTATVGEEGKVEEVEMQLSDLIRAEDEYEPPVVLPVGELIESKKTQEQLNKIKGEIDEELDEVEESRGKAQVADQEKQRVELDRGKHRIRSIGEVQAIKREAFTPYREQLQDLDQRLDNTYGRVEEGDVGEANERIARIIQEIENTTPSEQLHLLEQLEDELRLKNNLIQERVRGFDKIARGDKKKDRKEEEKPDYREHKDFPDDVEWTNFAQKSSVGPKLHFRFGDGRLWVRDKKGNRYKSVNGVIGDIDIAKDLATRLAAGERI